MRKYYCDLCGKQYGVNCETYLGEYSSMDAHPFVINVDNSSNKYTDLCMKCYGRIQDKVNEEVRQIEREKENGK